MTDIETKNSQDLEELLAFQETDVLESQEQDQEELPNEEPQILTIEDVCDFTSLLQNLAESDLDLNACQYALAKFSAALIRLHNTICSEITMLESYQMDYLQDINSRKTRGLRDLETALKEVSAFNHEEIHAYLAQALAFLQTDLNRNGELLKMHLDAAGEFAAILEAAFQEKETDGTYGPYSTNIELK